MAAARLNADGTRDTGFGSGGMATFRLAGLAENATRVLVQPDGRVVLVGQATFERGPFKQADSDIVVLPSYGEGIPRSLVEAAACGKALVATDVRGCRDVVRDGENGLLVPMRDAEALARAVTRLVSDEPLRRGLGEAGRLDVLREWDERIVFRDTVNAYDELLQRISARAVGKGSIVWRRVLARASHRS
jgi:glycosyltransferase involved in cell wall biosynthesis